MIDKFIVVLVTVVFSLLCQNVAECEDRSEITQVINSKITSPQYSWENFQRSGLHVTALCSTRDGTVWIGDEEKRLLCYSPNNPPGKSQWRSFKVTKKGLPDPYIYAIEEDGAGRIWIGTGHSGVSLFDPVQDKWTNYGPKQGLGGWHVYSLLAAKDGSMWIATEGGLSQINTKGQVRTLMESNGIPDNQICDLEEDKHGNIWTVSFAGGAAKINKHGEISRINKDELVSQELSDIEIDSNGKVWFSGYGCISVFDPVGWRTVLHLVPKRSKVVSKRPIRRILPGMRYTALCEGSQGLMYFGTWRNGLWLIDTKRVKVEKVSVLKHDYIYRLIRHRDNRIIVGSYGPGIASIQVQPVVPTLLDKQNDKYAVQEVLDKIKEEGFDYLNSINKNMQLSIKEIEKRGSSGRNVVFIGEDWLTRGDWVNKYGSFYYILCGMNAPFDFYGSNAHANYNVYIGEHRRQLLIKPSEQGMHIYLKSKGTDLPVPTPQKMDDSLRRWIHWKQTDNIKVLVLPPEMGQGRRHAEWDDHAEVYPYTWTGPHIYFDLRINESSQNDGVYILSLYFMNKDGHRGNNRFRDYMITIKRAVEPWGSGKPRGWEGRFQMLPELARARVHDFRGGVYYRFLIREGNYTVKIDKRGSFNTTIAGVFLDKVRGSGPDKPNVLATTAPWIRSSKEAPR